MDRRNFISLLTSSVTAASISPHRFYPLSKNKKSVQIGLKELSADLVIAGGGLGGCAAALSALRNGLTVILTEETDWIGGQLTQQGVPPDEHDWIETHGGTQLYRDLRTSIRQYYRQYYSLTDEAKKQEHLNPGNGSVSALCHEPRAALAVLRTMMAPYISSKQLTLLIEHKVKGAEVSGDKVDALTALNNRNGKEKILTAPYFVDATELGDLLPMTGTEYRTGTESRGKTGELHAPETGDPDNHQAFTYCFAMDYEPGFDNTIEKPSEYDFWKDYTPDLEVPWPGKLLELNYSSPSTLKPRKLGFHPKGVRTGDTLNLWNYRRIIDTDNFTNNYAGDITIVNWPQNDYMAGNLFGEDDNQFQKTVKRSKQLSLSLFYWLQTDAPRPDGGAGWPGLRLRPDIMGTDDGLAKYPYVRESRRIEALFTVLEEHVGREQRAAVTGQNQSEVSAADFYDSVGIGYYRIDLHPSSRGDNYIDFSSLPFEVPLGSLLPKRMKNLLPANKNIGTTHITNGCYRLHPVEWNIGESVGMLVAQAIKKNITPHAIRENDEELKEFQKFIRSQGIETKWPD